MICCRDRKTSSKPFIYLLIIRLWFRTCLLSSMEKRFQTLSCRTQRQKVKYIDLAKPNGGAPPFFNCWKLFIFLKP